MSRLWDKGASLDERVLRYTAGEDHALDNRLVAGTSDDRRRRTLTLPFSRTYRFASALASK